MPQLITTENFASTWLLSSNSMEHFKTRVLFLHHFFGSFLISSRQKACRNPVLFKKHRSFAIDSKHCSNLHLINRNLHSRNQWICLSIRKRFREFTWVTQKSQTLRFLPSTNIYRMLIISHFKVNPLDFTLSFQVAQ